MASNTVEGGIVIVNCQFRNIVPMTDAKCKAFVRTITIAVFWNKGGIDIGLLNVYLIVLGGDRMSP